MGISALTNALQIPSPVLITGATGFIGRRLTQSLMRAGRSVAAVVLPGDAENLPEGVGAYTGDVGDPLTLASAVEDWKPACIFHLAAVGLTNPNLPMGVACRVNVGGAINVLEAARMTKSVERVILVGSSYEYGARRADDTLDPFNAYSASKAAAWAFARAAYNSWGTPVVGVRPFQIYGPGQPPRALVPAAVLAALRGEDFRMTEGQQQRDFVFVDDVVEGLLAVGGTADIEGRVLDLGSGELRSLYDVVARIWALTEARGEILAGALPYRPGEVSAIPSSVRRTRLLTGWQARMPLDEGLRRTIEALRSRVAGTDHRARMLVPSGDQALGPLEGDNVE